ncbi:MAG: Gfo/Idh/MocA family oxidoreductase [Spirochaetota bacterium]|nr:Gfo/Idh/MocA family oxidoreductase [Spirochaetota bacterium]
MKQVGVIGCGHWGPKLIKNFHQSEFWNVKMACDLDNSKLDIIEQSYPDIVTSQNYSRLLDDNQLDAIVISTPLSSHYQLAKEALTRGKHVWVEKPFVQSPREAEELITLADNNNLTLHVDHTDIYNPAVRRMKEITDSGELGQIYYFNFSRANLGLFQKDINVVWDLAPHDISMLNYLYGKKPLSLSATGKSHISLSGKKQENIAYINFQYENNCIAHLHVNWLSPEKTRQLVIAGSKKILIFNDLLDEGKLRLYDCGVKVETNDPLYEESYQYWNNGFHSLDIPGGTALEHAVADFYRGIEENTDTESNGPAALAVIRVLEAIDRSLENNGETLYLNPDPLVGQAIS